MVRMGNIVTPDFTKHTESILDSPGNLGLRRRLRVVYTGRLKRYLETQKHRDILISAYKPHGHMAVAEVNIQIINPNLANKLIERGTPYVPAEMGRVLISRTWIPDGRNRVVELDLGSWMGIKNITAKGLKRQDVLKPFAPIIDALD